MENDDEQPNIEDLLNQLYGRQSSVQSSKDEDSSYTRFNPNDKSLVKLPSEIRSALEDRFIELIHEHPCFYDPQDKNFAHNQYKSNVYAEIARKMCSEGLETSGSLLAALFKSIKAKYREEARKINRSNGKIESSDSFKRLHFLEDGLSKLDRQSSQPRGISPTTVEHTQPSKESNRKSTIAEALEQLKSEDKTEIINLISQLVGLSNANRSFCLKKFIDETRQLESDRTPTTTMNKTDDGEVNSMRNLVEKQTETSEQESSLTSDLHAIGRSFNGEADLLALFRVLGSSVVRLTPECRIGHLQSLLTITTAAQKSPISIQWQSPIYNPVDGWVTTRHNITISGPSQCELNQKVKNESSGKSMETYNTEPPVKQLRLNDDMNRQTIINNHKELIVENLLERKSLPRAAKGRKLVKKFESRILRHR
ncbi:hypothetical protein M3Y95_00702500 [Aphelenchoides besseyi]|nr:hypothetical protein M3Y95_00702500 [Aphelenchoides besseyi]